MNNYTKEYIYEILRKNDKSTLVRMINEGVDVNTMVIPHHTDILLLSILNGGHQFFKMILESGFICNPANGFLYLHHAIRSHDVYMLDLVMDNYRKNDFNYDEKYTNGDNCLHVAAREFGIPVSIFEHLTDAGISWTETNVDGKTPLHLLLENRNNISGHLLEIVSKIPDLFLIKDKNSVSVLDLVGDLAKDPLWAHQNVDLIKVVKDVHSGK